MPTIISLSSGEIGITIAINGRTRTITPAQIKAAYDGDAGAIGTRKARVAAALANAASTALNGVIDGASIVIDFDPATGLPISVAAS